MADHKEAAFAKVIKPGGEDFRGEETDLAGSGNMMTNQTWAQGVLLDLDLEQATGERKPLEVADGPERPEN